MDFKLNLKRDNPDKRDFQLKISKEKKYLIENNVIQIVDHSLQMSPVKNQGRLGSCVSFAVTALKEWQEKKEYIFEKYVLGKDKQRKDEDEFNFSEQWLYYNCKKIDPWPDEEGTSIRYAMKVLQKVGIPVEDGWQYNDIDKGKPESWAYLIARWNKIGKYYRINDTNSLKNALVYSPVPVGIAVFEEMMNPGKSGIVRMPTKPDVCYGGHAICMVGFNDNNKLFKFKNSWGVEWGDNGYGYLPYEYIENYMWDAWCCDDIRVVQEMLKGKQDDLFLY